MKVVEALLGPLSLELVWKERLFALGRLVQTQLLVARKVLFSELFRKREKEVDLGSRNKGRVRVGCGVGLYESGRLVSSVPG